VPPRGSGGLVAASNGKKKPNVFAAGSQKGKGKVAGAGGTSSGGAGAEWDVFGDDPPSESAAAAVPARGSDGLVAASNGKNKPNVFAAGSQKGKGKVAGAGATSSGGADAGGEWNVFPLEWAQYFSPKTVAAFTTGEATSAEKATTLRRLKVVLLINSGNFLTPTPSPLPTTVRFIRYSTANYP
jgi:hypothetical protein